jgi:hypothetical protein
VGLHVATAAALLVFFWRDWLRILTGFATSLRYRRIQTPAERMAWLIVLATIPVGISGLALEHLFRTTLGKPIPAAAFLMVNGVILYGAERLRRRAVAPVGAVAVGAGAPDSVEGPEAANGPITGTLDPISNTAGAVSAGACCHGVHPIGGLVSESQLSWRQRITHGRRHCGIGGA